MSGMARRSLGWVAWIVPAVCAALLGVSLLTAAGTNTAAVFKVENLAVVPLSLGFSLVGALIVSRRPQNRLGQLYLVSATAMALTPAVYQYAYYGLTLHPGSLPGALAAAWVSAWIWTLGFAPLFTFGILVLSPMPGCPPPGGGGFRGRRADRAVPAGPGRPDAGAPDQPPGRQPDRMARCPSRRCG